MQATLAFNVRPIKVGYFIDDDDIDSFAQVALLCCTQWGGIHNLIVPVKATGVDPVFAQLFELESPDIVVKAAIRQKEVQDLFLEQSLRGVATREWPAFAQQDDTVHAARLYPEWANGDQSVMALGDPRPDLLIFMPEPHHDAFTRACVTAAFGGIYPDQESFYNSRLHLIKSNLIVPGDPFLELQLRRDPFASPINLTRTAIHTYMIVGFMEQAHFDVVLASSVWDLCWYWNRRAVEDVRMSNAKRHTLLVPASDFVRDDLRKQLIDLIRRELRFEATQFCSDLDINFVTSNAGSVSSPAAIRQTEQQGLIRKAAPNEQLLPTWRIGHTQETELPERFRSSLPLVYVTNPELFIAAQHREGLDYTPPKPVELREGNNVFLVPPRPALGHNAGRVALDVEGELWDRYPRTARVAQYVHDGSYFTHYGLTAQLTLPSFDMRWDLNLPPPFDSLRMYFQDRELEATLGPAGRKAQALISLIGGIEECALLQKAPVFQVLQALAMKTTTKLAQNVANLLHGRIGALSEEDRAAVAEVVRDGLAESDVLEAVGRTPSTLRQLQDNEDLRPFRDQILDVLDALIARRVVFRGAHVRCRACDSRPWFPLSALSDVITCPGCFTEQPVSANVDGGERPWEYRLNAAVNTALDQDILTPVLLLAKLTAERQGIFAPTVGIELSRTGEKNALGDFDIAYVQKQAVYAGECKAGSRLEEKDIKLAELARELGCAGFHFAALNDFDQRSLAMIAKLQAELHSSGSKFIIEVHGRAALILSGPASSL